MKILVLAENYPDNNNGRALMFAHVRNKGYLNNGVIVDVINFSANEKYCIDGINVYSLKDWVNNDIVKYDLLICHAPNIRHHYIFLKKYSVKFPKILFIFHGHEVLRINENYPEPYAFKKQNVLRRKFQDIYDSLKLKILSKWFIKNINKVQMIFVSNWLKVRAMKNLKICDANIKNHVSIINNSVGKIFEEKYYDVNCEKKYDFISIRSNFDNSTYCVDIINYIAKNNPNKKLLLIGKGEYFNYYEKADNLEWINTTLSHEDMLRYVDMSKCALLPTRHDTQGVIACEMATYGIPLITSDIEICKEIFGMFENVVYINNNDLKLNLDSFHLKTNIAKEKNRQYFAENTINKELKLFDSLVCEIENQSLN